MAIVGATLWGIGVVLSLIICIITIFRSNYRCRRRKVSVQSYSHLGNRLTSSETNLQSQLCTTSQPASSYRLRSRESNVQPVSWALVLQHFVSLICFLFGLFLAWQSDEPAVQPLLPYAVCLTALCLAAQLTLMLLQARRSHPTNFPPSQPS